MPTSTTTSLSGVYGTIDPDQAQAQFWFFFFAGSGAGGIGLGRVPAIFQEFQDIKALAGQGPTAGGEPIGTGGIVKLLFPDPISAKDVEDVIQKIPTPAEGISERGNAKETSRFAKLGYVVPADFEQALAGCNPLAVSAAYEALSGGSGKAVSPNIVDDKLAVWRTDGLAAFEQDLQNAVVTRFAAYFGLAFLLLFTLDIVVETGINAFG